MCGTGRFRDERNGVNVAAQFLWWEIQSNDHVFEKGFADPSSFVFEGEGIDGLFNPLPTASNGRVRQ